MSISLSGDAFVSAGRIKGKIKDVAAGRGISHQMKARDEKGVWQRAAPTRAVDR
ncbi:hypothetical protein [Sphingomonas natans]|uniref:hypothetical protein n=1 Tax=Sphingomonas natans TaxID=3063330 RepID=UPI0026E1DCA6|nr:hypothetical protein [Sphingomonas sp. BIUV-7]